MLLKSRYLTEGDGLKRTEYHKLGLTGNILIEDEGVAEDEDDMSTTMMPD